MFTPTSYNTGMSKLAATAALAYDIMRECEEMQKEAGIANIPFFQQFGHVFPKDAMKRMTDFHAWASSVNPNVAKAHYDKLHTLSQGLSGGHYAVVEGAKRILRETHPMLDVARTPVDMARMGSLAKAPVAQ